MVTHAADSNGSVPKKVVVVGAGWAGFGATKHLAEQGLIRLLPHGGDVSILALTRVVSAAAVNREHQYPNNPTLLHV